MRIKFGRTCNGTFVVTVLIVHVARIVVGVLAVLIVMVMAVSVLVLVFVICATVDERSQKQLQTTLYNNSIEPCFHSPL